MAIPMNRIVVRKWIFQNNKHRVKKTTKIHSTAALDAFVFYCCRFRFVNRINSLPTEAHKFIRFFALFQVGYRRIGANHISRIEGKSRAVRTNKQMKHNSRNGIELNDIFENIATSRTTQSRKKTQISARQLRATIENGRCFWRFEN